MCRAPRRTVDLTITVASIALLAVSLVQAALATDAIGWRKDGNGEFEASAAPVHWSREVGTLWKTPLPATSLSSPIVVDDRAFLMAEPNRLYCVSMSNGEILWDRAHEYEAVFGKEKTAEIHQYHAESQRVRVDIAELEKQLKTVQEADPDSKELSSLRERITQLQQRDAELTVIPPPHVDATGNTASTPVSDGKNVYAVLGNGLVSSHDFEGRLNWIRFLGKPMPRHSASPLIVGELLFLPLQQLVAVNCQSGEIIWTAETPPRNGTPVALEVGDQSVLITPAGAVVCVADGTVLANGLFDLTYCSPITKNGVVYAAERGRLVAIKLLPGKADDTIGTEMLWQTRSAQEDRLASPVIHGDLLFSVTGSGILDVADVKTGRIIKRQRMEFQDGRVDASLSLANERLYVHNTNGTTVVLEPTAESAELARNETDGASSSPFFVGERLLLRTSSHLICLGGR